MNTAYYQGNRERLYAMMQPGSLLMLFFRRRGSENERRILPVFSRIGALSTLRG